MKLHGTHVLVTGALGGIGIPTLKTLQDFGARVMATDVAATENAKALLATHGLDAIDYVPCELTNTESLSQLTEHFSAVGDIPNAMVSLAGRVVSGDLHLQTQEDIAGVLNVNVVAQANLAKNLLSLWIQHGIQGQFVFTSSWVSHVPWPSITPYAASKAAVVALARGIAREYAQHGIRSNVISPGIVDVGMAAKQWREEPDYRARASRAIPLGRLQRPEEVAEGIAFLLSPHAYYMTGSVLEIDGGASLYPLDSGEVQS